jgi:hypothetical protein
MRGCDEGNRLQRYLLGTLNARGQSVSEAGRVDEVDDVTSVALELEFVDILSYYFL